MSNTKIRKITLRAKTVLTAKNLLKTSKNVTSNYIKAFWNEGIRDTQRLFSVTPAISLEKEILPRIFYCLNTANNF